MKYAIFFIAMMFPLATFANDCKIDIIPRPAEVQCLGGSFKLNQKTRIVATDETGRKMAGILNDLLLANYGFKLEYSDKPQKSNAIVFTPAVPTTGSIPNPEGYSLTIENGSVRISGSENGQFYGIRTLLQLLPHDRRTEFQIPHVKIADSPRFQYRGMHLDVARHFMPVSFVKKFIELMSQYKFNYFHWHLTEDQGWRIEIKKYPRLTEIGSKRPESVKERNLTPYIGDGIPHGGFYTQEEIKDVVKYAKSSFITVIPEIELPGHASAALAAYPQFGCKPDYNYKVQTTWGIFKEVYCPTDETFKFLEDVLDETIALFPDSPYIHIGGDEVLKDHWKESAFVQELKRRENLKDEHEVQSYFVRRIERYINSKGKKMIGWDEILEGGLAPNATVMSWRGMKGGIEAAKSKHDVIMTPTDNAYLDYGQGDPAYEPLNIGNHLPLEKVYSFEPVPKELSADEAKYVIGGQGNIWTEYMKTPEKVEYMAFPRMLALAEVVWSRAEDKNFTDFAQRLAPHLRRLDKQDVKYRIPEPGGLQNTVTAAEEISLELRPATGTRVHYTIDGSVPDEKSTVYSGPVKISLASGKSVTLKTVVVLSSGRKSGVYAATLMRGSLREPSNFSGPKKTGVTFEFIAGAAGSAGKSGETNSILLNQFARDHDLKQPFGVTLDGFLNVPADGIYEFQVESTWKTKLTVGGSFVDIDGTSAMAFAKLLVPLKAGPHKLSLRQDHRGGDAVLNLRWGLKGTGLRRIYGGELFH